MSMTLWVHTLVGRQLTSYHDDHSLMQEYVSRLDPICTSGGVIPLSSFCDYTDAKANISEDDESSDEIDPETGWSYGIDDMSWFATSNGLMTLIHLRSRIADGSRDG